MPGRTNGVNFEQSTFDLTAIDQVSVAARRFRRRLETDRRLRALAEEAESYLSNV